MLLHRGTAVHKSTILELLSPEIDKKRAMTQLYTVIYQIRQCLQGMKLDVRIVNASIQESYILQLGDHVTVDSEDWEKRLVEARESDSSSREMLGPVLGEYEADYLQDHDYVWAEIEKERLRGLWLQHARVFGDHLMEQERLEEALSLYERVQAMDPYHEAEMLIVLELFDRLGHYDKVISYYDRLHKLFWEELELSLPASITKWFQQWKLAH